jgi:hypothetical protein
MVPGVPKVKVANVPMLKYPGREGLSMLSVPGTDLCLAVFLRLLLSLALCCCSGFSRNELAETEVVELATSAMECDSDFWGDETAGQMIRARLRNHLIRPVERLEILHVTRLSRPARGYRCFHASYCLPNGDLAPLRT